MRPDRRRLLASLAAVFLLGALALLVASRHRLRPAPPPPAEPAHDELRAEGLEGLHRRLRDAGLGLHLTEHGWGGYLSDRPRALPELALLPRDTGQAERWRGVVRV